MRRTKNLFQTIAPEKVFSLRRLNYVRRDTLEFSDNSEELGATHITGERFEEGTIAWTLQDKKGKKYIVGSEQEKLS